MQWKSLIFAGALILGLLAKEAGGRTLLRKAFLQPDGPYGPEHLCALNVAMVRRKPVREDAFLAAFGRSTVCPTWLYYPRPYWTLKSVGVDL